VPASLWGGWRRHDLVVGGVPRDDADVRWLQAGDWYADLRIPHEDGGGPIEAFAGRADWVAPHFTWHHDLDWIGSFPVDVGALQWDGDVLIETGTFHEGSGESDYRERWLPITPGGPVVAAVGERRDSGEGSAIVVQAAGHRFSVARIGTGERATMAVRRDDEAADDGWTTRFDRGAGCEAAPMPDLGGRGEPLPVGAKVPVGAWTFEIVASGDRFEAGSNLREG
jgi:hypothetical protein